MFDYLKELDREVFLLINGCNSAAFDSIMFFISGKFSWIPFYVFLLYLMIRVAGKNIIYIIPAAIILIILSDQGSVLFFKNIFHRLRPCHEESLKGFVHIVNGTCGGQFGFISSHAANTMAISIFVFLFLRNKFPKQAFLIFIFPLLVGYSRVYLGIHYPADVLCGIIFGAIVGCVIAMLTLQIISKK